MKKYDHEPTISELVQQLQEEYAYLPDFIDPIKIPIIGKKINKLIVESMVKTFVNFMLV